MRRNKVLGSNFIVFFSNMSNVELPIIQVQQALMFGRIIYGWTHSISGPPNTSPHALKSDPLKHPVRI